jgi:hypothetical protein
VTIAAAAITVASSLWPVTGPIVLVKGGVLTALFGAALILLREVGREDLERLRKIFRAGS